MNPSGDNKKVDIKAFAEMAGFPEELVRKELFRDADDNRDVSLEELRAAMVTYLDLTMLDS